MVHKVFLWRWPVKDPVSLRRWWSGSLQELQELVTDSLEHLGRTTLLQEPNCQEKVLVTDNLATDSDSRSGCAVSRQILLLVE